MKIAIGTTNSLKISAIEEALRQLFENPEFVIVKAESGVGETPRGEEEGIKGALNRARRAMQDAAADMGVGPEGIISTNSHGTFVYGYVVIVDKYERIGIGASAQVMLPRKLAELIMSGRDLAEAMSMLSNKSAERIKTELGTNGILTNGRYDRKKEFFDATLCAAARFVNDLYD